MKRFNLRVVQAAVWLLIAVWPSIAQAQSGAIDPSFNSMDVGFGNGDGANNIVYTTALQPDGKIIIGGNFDSYNGTIKDKIARLNADGSLDANFNVGVGANNTVYTTAIQADGKIIIGGWFDSYGGTSRNRVARLHADGTLDATFNPGSGADGSIVSCSAIQSDGKIIIAGQFTSFNGVSRNNICRLNADGSLDASFDPGSGSDSQVNTIAIQPDGKIIIGGYFNNYGGTSRNRIARLHADGTLDTTFNPGAGLDGTLWSVTLQPNGKIIIGGSFTSFDGVARNRIARINVDGSIDLAFNAGTGADGVVSAIALQLDGKIILGGDFTQLNGVNRNKIARLNLDGTLDATFNPGAVIEFSPYIGGVHLYTISIQSNGSIIIGGMFQFFVVGGNINRLNADGSADTTFNVGTGADNMVNSVVLQPDGKIIIGGSFTTFNGLDENGIARLNADGMLDVTFNSGTGSNADIYTLALQADGKIIIVGDFTTFNGIARNRIARLNADGSLDTTFNPGIGANNTVYTIALQPDGKIIIGGFFTNFNGIGRNRIARLNADGTLDTTFNPGTGTDSWIYTTALQPDGKIIIGGDFMQFNGEGINKIARLNSDGTLDETFNTNAGSNGVILTTALQADGKIIIGGTGTNYNEIARLNTDGSLDVTFNAVADPEVYTIALQPDGKIIIGGVFTTLNGIARKGIARLNADGSLDGAFNPGTGVIVVPSYSVGSLSCCALQADGKLIIGGEFNSYNGTGRNRLARVFAYEAIVPASGNDTPIFATNLQYSSNMNYPNCYPIQGNFSGSTDSPESITFTGPDEWYRFTAQSAAVSITLSSALNDDVIELYQKVGLVYTLMPGASENASAGAGDFERLNYTGLIPGTTYYVSVGAASGIASGSYSLCIQHLMPSTCATPVPSGGLNLCDSYKASYRGSPSQGVTYTFNFTPTGITSGSSTSISGTNGLISLSNPILALRYTGTYTASVDVRYNLLNSAGIAEPIDVVGSTGGNCSNVVIRYQPNVEVRATQRCNASLLRSNWLVGTKVLGDPGICGAINYTYRFIQVVSCDDGLNVALSTLYTTTGNTPYLQLGVLPNLGNVGAWDVRIRPNFIYGPGVFGPMHRIQVAGTAASGELLYEAVDAEKELEVENTLTSIYPNPSSGDFVHVNLSNLEKGQLQLRVLDAAGRVLITRVYAVEGSLNTTFTFDEQLSSGVYMMETLNAGRVQTQRLVVQ